MKTQDADTKAGLAELGQDVVAKGLRDGKVSLSVRAIAKAASPSLTQELV